MTDTITLTIPHDRPFHGVARLVLGGVGARLELPLEALEDVELALEAVLAENAYAAGETVTVRMEVEDGTLGLAVGPLRPEALEQALEADPAEGVGLGRLLRTVVGDYQVEQLDGAGWLRMRKALTTPGEGGG
jgi:anti-sigma regulatory factor (Ser/Thr protein kinase)